MRDATVAFATLGCKLNQYDTTEMQSLLEAKGLRQVPFEEPATIYVINTCTVTARADRSGRQVIRRALARNPDALVVVTGCYAQTNPEAVAAIPGVDVVLGTRDRSALPGVLDDLAKRARPLVRVGDVFAPRGRPEPVIPVRAFAPGYTRAFVKIQDGCQHRCSFCIVPFARGGSRSQPESVVVAQVEALAAAGYGEVVLTGVDMGHYGWDLVPRTSLAALIARILRIPGLGRLRLSSILPAYFSDALIDLIAAERRICRHLHVPLQSGSDQILRAMRRPYNARLYRRLIERLCGTMPGLGLGTDVITGFPGETAQDFAATEALVADLPFSYLHVFSYSDRRGTEAARLAVSRVPAAEIRRRTAALRHRSAAKADAFRRAHLGRIVEALVLERRTSATDRLVGLTDDYLEVTFDGPDRLRRSFVRLEVTGVDDEGLGGRLAGASDLARLTTPKGLAPLGPGDEPQGVLVLHD